MGMLEPVLDAVVVGAGPTGLACGIELQRVGLTAKLFDKGCVVNSLYNYPTNMVFFTTPDLLEIGDIPMTSIGEKPTRAEALENLRGMHPIVDDIPKFLVEEATELTPEAWRPIVTAREDGGRNSGLSN